MSKLEDYLAGVKARCEITPPPWKWDDDQILRCADGRGSGIMRCDPDFDTPFPDEAEFIAHSRTDVEVLLKMVEELLPLVDAPVVKAARNNLEFLVPEEK